MAGTPPEDLLAWLTREEERLGTTAVARAAGDYAATRDLLYDELGYEPEVAQIESLMGAYEVKNAILPELGIGIIPRETRYGKVYSYYNYATHRFTGAASVMEAVRTWTPAAPHRFR